MIWPAFRGPVRPSCVLIKTCDTIQEVIMARLYEFQGKQILREAKVATPKGEVATIRRRGGPHRRDDRQARSREGPGMGRRQGQGRRHQVRRQPEGCAGGRSGPSGHGVEVVEGGEGPGRGEAGHRDGILRRHHHRPIQGFPVSGRHVQHRKAAWTSNRCPRTRSGR